MIGKNVFKILLDILMTALYVLLIFAPATGDFFHEVAGIGIGVLFILHVSLNWTQLKSLWKSVTRGAPSLKNVIMLIFDLLLPIGMPVVIITGLFISRVLLNIDTGTAWMTIYRIHTIAAYLCLSVLALHILAHAKYLAAVAKQMFLRWNESVVKRVVRRFAAASLAVGILYTLAFSSYKNSISGSAFSKETLASSAVSPKLDTTYPGDAAESADSNSSAAGTSTGAAEEEDKKKISASSGTQDAAVTLSEYLSKLYCTGCHNHCPLSSPRCGRSSELIENATADYYDEYTTG